MDKIIIYGAGNMGKAACELLRGRCEIAGFMDANRAVRGTELMGVPVYHPEDAVSNRELLNMTVLVAMTVCSFASMRKMLTGLGFSDIVPAGDYAAARYEGITILNTWRCGGDLPEPAFSDEKSMRDYRAACKWFQHRKDEDFDLTKKKYFPAFLDGQIAQCKIMLDTAALDGGYIRDFLEKIPGRSAYAYTLMPPTVPPEVLRNRFGNDAVRFFEKEAADCSGYTDCRRVGLMQPFTRMDNYRVEVEPIDLGMKDTPFDYLRCYSMSEILPVLRGAEKSIELHRPLIAANIGHYQSDFAEVPAYLKTVCRNYDFYFRMHSYQGNDCILYAAPRGKSIRILG